jgi:hypothetical protein
MYLSRIELHKKLIPNQTKVKFIRGKNIGKEGIITYKSQPNNSVYYCRYTRYQFHDYFSITVKVGNRKIPTSCNNIKIIQ